MLKLCKVCFFLCCPILGTGWIVIGITIVAGKATTSFSTGHYFFFYKTPQKKQKQNGHSPRDCVDYLKPETSLVMMVLKIFALKNRLICNLRMLSVNRVVPMARLKLEIF